MSAGLEELGVTDEQAANRKSRKRRRIDDCDRWDVTDEKSRGVDERPNVTDEKLKKATDWRLREVRCHRWREKSKGVDERRNVTDATLQPLDLIATDRPLPFSELEIATHNKDCMVVAKCTLLWVAENFLHLAASFCKCGSKINRFWDACGVLCGASFWIC